MELYIENNNGDRFNVEATMKDKKTYEKNLQNSYSKAIYSKLTKEERENLKTLSETDKKKAEEFLTETLTEKASLVDNVEITSAINRQTMITLLAKTNKQSEKNMQALIDELYETYGEEQVDLRFAKILDKVFTQLGVVEYKTMPAWGLED